MIGGNDYLEQRGAFAGEAWIPLGGPGQYRVEISAIDGYSPIAPQLVSVTWEGGGELEVVLQRSD